MITAILVCVSILFGDRMAFEDLRGWVVPRVLPRSYQGRFVTVAAREGAFPLTLQRVIRSAGDRDNCCSGCF